MYDHRVKSGDASNFGECKMCWCVAYKKVEPPPVKVTFLSEYTSLSPNAPVIDWILERIERKGCPQGLNVMAEELRWLGMTEITHDKLVQAVKKELRSSSPRIQALADEVYWYADRRAPAGWALFRDPRMLPCFYRQYPPDISWEEIDSPNNILPPPKR